MRVIKYAVVMLFVLMIVAPVVTMNVAPDSISKIDNRALAKIPFGEGALRETSQRILRVMCRIALDFAIR